MAKTKRPNTTSADVPPLPPARIVQHLHWPIEAYRQVQRAAHTADMSINEYVRTAATIVAQRDADVAKEATRLVSVARATRKASTTPKRRAK